MKASPDVAKVIRDKEIQVSECSYGCITRMELLGYENIDATETMLIQAKLDQMKCLDLTESIENRVIQLRRFKSIKMPDAIIAAKSLEYGLELLTFDARLLKLLEKDL